MSNLKVLCVEDEEITRIILKKMLKQHFGKIILAENGFEGYKAYLKHKPNLIVTDLRMPIMGGIDMIAKIREIDQECGIIITSEVEDIDLILRSVDLGIDKYLVKPIVNEQFLEDLQFISNKIMKRKLSELEDCFLIEAEQKKFIEEQIKKKYSSYIKEKTGKGPLDILVFLLGDEIEIKSIGGLTTYEITLLENKNNESLVEYNRRLFYRDKKEELEELIKSVINANVKMNNVEIEATENEEILSFQIEI